jgi:catechol 2,3-dioxygenase-like lactoylglutathione lyase family enzyme
MPAEGQMVSWQSNNVRNRAAAFCPRHVEVRPEHQPGSPDAMANELGLRNVAFEVDDLQATVDRLAADGYGLVDDIGQYDHVWRMAYVRGPEGIIGSLAERID